MPVFMHSLLSWLRAIAFAIVAGVLPLPAQAQATATQDADEAELLQSFDRVDVWHFPVDYSVAYNNQDVIVTRELVAQPAPAGKLCYIRFDLLQGEGDYAFGFKPQQGALPAATQWGVYVHKRGTVLNQARSVLKMNVIYFFVDGPKSDSVATDICVRKQAANTQQAGHGYNAPQWSDLVVRARLVHGWPMATQ